MVPLKIGVVNDVPESKAMPPLGFSYQKISLEEVAVRVKDPIPHLELLAGDGAAGTATTTACTPARTLVHPEIFV